MHPERQPNGRVPDWIPILPPGPVLRPYNANDPRPRLRVDDPAGLAARSLARFGAIPLDYDHAVARFGGPAAGWLEAMRVGPDGAIWARTVWTPAGRVAVRDGHYRYLSPVLPYDRNNRVAAIHSVALVNAPAFDLRIDAGLYEEPARTAAA